MENTPKKLLHNNKFGNSKRRVLLLVACQGESHKMTLSHSYSAAVYIFVLVLMPFKETETCTKRKGERRRRMTPIIDVFTVETRNVKLRVKVFRYERTKEK